MKLSTGIKRHGAGGRRLSTSPVESGTDGRVNASQGRSNPLRRGIRRIGKSNKARSLLLGCALPAIAIGCGTAAHTTAPPRPTATATQKPLPPLGTGFWHTQGTEIVDSYNRPLRISGGTWFGMETTHWVPSGLDFQPYQKIMDLTKRLGYNTIRLAISNQMVEQNPIVTQYIAKNPQFRGKHALQVLDAIAGYAHQIGLKIIIDDQRSAAATDQNIGSLQEGLWYTQQYPQSAWIHDWVTLARRYRNNDAVIGFDLRNEPHTIGPGPWSLNTYRNQGSTWGPDPYTGVDNPASDWRLAAEAAGNAVLAVNPHLLMFVEGVQLYPDSSRPSGVDSYWWAGILSPVRNYPVVFKVPHQLVYSPHEYGPMKVDFYWFPGMTYQSMKQVWDSKWAFIVNNPKASYAAPVWIGEMGTCTDHMWCIDDQQPGNQAQWFHFFLRFLRNHPNVGWDIWALNGTNAKDEVANNGILNAQWNGVANQALENDLQTIQRR